MSKEKQCEKEEIQLQVNHLRNHASNDGCPFEMIGSSATFLAMRQEIRLVADWHEPVLITGERGSGKDLAANQIHLWSTRCQFPFVPIYIPALSESMLADELFGHKRGAFTGAREGRLGRFAAAEGGTVFLDEIGDLSPVSQAALLRVSETQEITRVGEDLPFRADVRIVAATNKNLPELVKQGRFRADLYDRLRVFEIRVPPLRERRDDIPLLIGHFLKGCCLKAGCPARSPDRDLCWQEALPACATAEFYNALKWYDWPGNVRELREVVVRLRAWHRGVIMDPGLLYTIKALQQISHSSQQPDDDNLSFETAARKHIERVLSESESLTIAAKKLCLPRSTLRNKMIKLGISQKR